MPYTCFLSSPPARLTQQGACTMHQQQKITCTMEACWPAFVFPAAACAVQGNCACPSSRAPDAYSQTLPRASNTTRTVNRCCPASFPGGHARQSAAAEAAAGWDGKLAAAAGESQGASLWNMGRALEVCSSSSVHDKPAKRKKHRLQVCIWAVARHQLPSMDHCWGRGSSHNQLKTVKPASH